MSSWGDDDVLKLDNAMVAQLHEYTKKRLNGIF